MDVDQRNQSLIDQLVRIYLEEETWHEKKLSKEDAQFYFEKMLQKERIIPICDNSNQLIAYVESWRVNYEQFGRIICGVEFSAPYEPVESGQICYVANTWVKKEFRRGETIRMLRNLFFQQNFACEFFVGEARRKRSAPVKVFRRQQFYDKYIGKQEKKEGSING